MTNPRHHQDPTLNLFKARDIEQVQRWIDAGADVNARNKKGATPLFNAARKGWPDAVRLLLRSGASIDVSNQSGQSLAMAVARCSSKECLDLLVKAGLNPLVKGESGESGLMLATNIEVMQALIDAGDRIDDTDSLGRTVVHYIANRDLCSVPHLMPFLISKGADINVRDDSGSTPLMLGFNQMAMGHLLDLGADASLYDHDGDNVLHYIARHKYRMSDEIMLRCVDAGADPDAENIHGDTPIDLMTKNMNKYGGPGQEVFRRSIALVQQKALDQSTRQVSSPTKKSGPRL